MTAIDVTDPAAGVAAPQRPALAVMVAGVRRGAGATVIATAITDVASSLVGKNNEPAKAVLMDVSPPYEATDLVVASGADSGQRLETATPGVHFRTGNRPSGATYLGLDSPDSRRTSLTGFFGRHLVPSPQEWIDAAGPQQIAVVDSSWCSLEAMGTHPDRFGEWAQLADIPVYPVVVMPASLPAIFRAESLLEAFESTSATEPVLAIPRATADTPEALESLAGHGSRVRALMSAGRVVLFPYDPAIEREGVPKEFGQHTFSAAHKALMATGALRVGR